MTDPRYPIGEFSYDAPLDLSAHARQARIALIGAMPAELARVMGKVYDQQLAQQYRMGGWTIRHIVHHVADSHMHGYLRFKFALTMPCPVIAPYDEAVWAEVPDYLATPVGISVNIITAVHARWHALLRTMRPDEFARGFFHPGAGKVLSLDVALAMYAWHGAHHLAHIHAALEAPVATR